MNSHEFSEEELDIAKQSVFLKYIGNPELYQSTEPTGLLLGGQPAAGKSELIKFLRQGRRPAKFVVINGDEYVNFIPGKDNLITNTGKMRPNTRRYFLINWLNF